MAELSRFDPAVVELTPGQREALALLVRQRIRKLERTIARFRPKQRQTEEEARFFRAKFALDLATARSILQALGEDDDE